MKFSGDLNYWFNPKEVDIDKEDAKMVAMVSCLILTFIGLIGVMVFKDLRRRAWTISLINSGVLSAVSIFYLVAYVAPNFPGVFRFEPNEDMFHGINNAGAVFIIWFWMANLMDMVIGMIFYMEKLEILSTFIHHPVFMWMSYFSVTGDGLFCSSRPFIPAFTMLFIVEVPTFLLALGSVFPIMRTDMGFGVTFFLFRVAFHFYMMALAYVSGVDTALFWCFVGPFLLHVFWFSTWVSKYAGGKKKRKDKHVE